MLVVRNGGARSVSVEMWIVVCQYQTRSIQRRNLQRRRLGVAIDLGQCFSYESPFSFERPWAKVTSETQCVEPALATWAWHHLALEAEARYQLSMHPIVWSSDSTTTNSSCNSGAAERSPSAPVPWKAGAPQSPARRRSQGEVGFVPSAVYAGRPQRRCVVFSVRLLGGKEKVRNILLGKGVQTDP